MSVLNSVQSDATIAKIHLAYAVALLVQVILKMAVSSLWSIASVSDAEPVLKHAPMMPGIHTLKAMLTNAHFVYIVFAKGMTRHA